ncbi:hypothetical protein Tco_0420557 [Tanacetum coccineum]
MNGLTGYGWDEFVVTSGIEWGQRIVFTNIERHTLSVVVFGGDGLGLSRKDICPTLLRREQRPFLYRDRNDKRMEHICPWPHHDDHSNEDNVLYVRLTSHVIDHDELNITNAFDEIDSNMHIFKKASVVHMCVSFEMDLQMVSKNVVIKGD